MTTFVTELEEEACVEEKAFTRRNTLLYKS